MDPRILNSNVMHRPNLAKAYKYLLPEKYQRPLLGLSITLMAIGMASIVMGGVGFANYYYRYNPSVFTGQDFWVGLALTTETLLNLAVTVQSTCNEIMDPRRPNSNFVYQPNVVKANYILPEKFQRPFLGISITLMIIGTASIVMGIMGFIRPFVVNPSVLTLQDFWVGGAYCLAGIFGTVTYVHRSNKHLMHTFYAFNIIGFIFSMAQFGISLASTIAFRYSSILWHSIISLGLSVPGFALTLTQIVILSMKIYCKPKVTNPTGSYLPANNNIGLQPATVVQQYPSQPGVIIMQDPEPMVVQQAPVTQYAVLPQAPAVQTSQIMLQPQTTQQFQPRI